LSPPARSGCEITEFARDLERFTSHLGSGWFDVFLLANKMRLVLHDVVQRWHWLLTRELLHQIVRSGKDSIATILGHGRYMLLDVRGVSHLVPDFPKGIAGTAPRRSMFTSRQSSDPAIHQQTTAEEIWADTDGPIKI
jgi:hypothetical protein